MHKDSDLHGGYDGKLLPRYGEATEKAIQEAREMMEGKVEAKVYDSADELFAALDAS